MRTVAVLSMLVVFAATSFGAPIFYEDFESYLNDTYGTIPGDPTTSQTFGPWTVIRNTVDVHGPDWVDWMCSTPTNSCLDLSGSYSAQTSGAIQTSIDFTPGFYVLSFVLGGSQRGIDPLWDGENTTQVTLGTWTQSYTLAPSEPFRTVYSPHIWLSGPTLLIFVDATMVPGSNPPQFVNDAMGLLLDDIRVDVAAPEPATVILLVLGAGLVALRRRVIA